MRAESYVTGTKWKLNYNSIVKIEIKLKQISENGRS